MPRPLRPSRRCPAPPRPRRRGSRRIRGARESGHPVDAVRDAGREPLRGLRRAHDVHRGADREGAALRPGQRGAALGRAVIADADGLAGERRRALGRATSTGRVAPSMTARAVSPATTRPSAPRCGEPMTSRSASSPSATRCRPRPGEVSAVAIACACHAGLGELPVEHRLGLLVRQRLDVRPQAAERERLVGVHVDGDELSTGEVADALRQRERVAPSGEPVDSNDDGGEHVADLGLGVHASSLGVVRPPAIRVDRAFGLWNSRRSGLAGQRCAVSRGPRRPWALGSVVSASECSNRRRRHLMVRSRRPADQSVPRADEAVGASYGPGYGAHDADLPATRSSGTTTDARRRKAPMLPGVGCWHPRRSPWRRARSQRRAWTTICARSSCTDTASSIAPRAAARSWCWSTGSPPRPRRGPTCSPIWPSASRSSPLICSATANRPSPGATTRWAPTPAASVIC